MCGRVVQASEPLRYAFVDGLAVPDSRTRPPSYNVAPVRSFTSSAITTRRARVCLAQSPSDRGTICKPNCKRTARHHTVPAITTEDGHYKKVEPKKRLATARCELSTNVSELENRQTRKRFEGSKSLPIRRAWIKRNGGLRQKSIILRGRELTALYRRC